MKSRIAELKRVADWAAQFGKQTDLPAETIYRVDLVLTELVSNIITYAVPRDPEREIALTGSAEGDGVRIEVRDGGMEFDPFQEVDPNRPTSLEYAQVGGWGIGLICSQSDAAAYERIDGHNVVRLDFRPR